MTKLKQIIEFFEEHAHKEMFIEDVVELCKNKYDCQITFVYPELLSDLEIPLEDREKYHTDWIISVVTREPILFLMTYDSFFSSSYPILNKQIKEFKQLLEQKNEDY